MKLSNRLYDFMKYLATIFMPAFATLYAALAQIWTWPNTTEIVLTITAVDTFLGVLLGLSSARYAADVALDRTVIRKENMP